ncbi:hypothetical protein [Maribacter sp. IgM3_T14_3]|uniref:hypothetical protein n=1 Tax=Maribacter sp. IgM3_T14_3 TaxID=3415140 RepID=UPI003C6FE35C
MKTLISLIIVIFSFGINSLSAQTVDYEIKLTQPDRSGTLKIDVYNAAIQVDGYEGKEVKLTIIDNRKGFKRKNGSAESYFRIIEDNNNVSILKRESTPGQVKGLKLEVLVPKSFSVNLSTYFGSVIELSGINGEVEAKGYFTNLLLNGLKKSVVASTNEGNIVVVFDTIQLPDIHFISNYKGNTEVYFPKNTKATLLIDNYFGNYDGDFKLELDASNKNNQKSKFLRRNIGGGGKEITLVNYYGNININSRKD